MFMVISNGTNHRPSSHFSLRVSCSFQIVAWNFDPSPHSHEIHGFAANFGMHPKPLNVAPAQNLS
jgi:hypothetical protein